MVDDLNPAQVDSPEARRYNSIRRWLGIADFLVGLAFPDCSAGHGLVGIGCATGLSAWDFKIIRYRFSCTWCCCW